MRGVFAVDAMADDYVMLVQGLEHGHNVGGAVLRIGIAPAHDFQSGGFEPGPDCRAVAADRLMDELYARVLRLDIPHNVRGAVRAVVVNNDNFIVPRHTLQRLHAVIHGSSDVLRLV